jgi:hypothetical protein
MNSLPIVESEGTVICHGIITDITDRINAEKLNKSIDSIYLSVSNKWCSWNWRTVNFREACNIAVKAGKFRMAWLVGRCNTNQVVPVMVAGEDNGYLS